MKTIISGEGRSMNKQNYSGVAQLQPWSHFGMNAVPHGRLSQTL